jgi:hypothetical protein
LSGVGYRAAAGVLRRGARESVDIVADIPSSAVQGQKRPR